MQVPVRAVAQRLAKRMRRLVEPIHFAQQGAAGAPRRGVARIDREQALEGGQRFLGPAELGERGGAMEQGVDAVALGRERRLGALSARRPGGPAAAGRRRG